jgi:hypothetical protein
LESAPQPIETSAMAPGWLRSICSCANPAADLIVGKRDAVTGVAQVDRPDSVGRIANNEDRQFMIDRSPFRPPIDRQINLADTPGEPRRLPVLKRCQRHLFELVD